MTKDEQRSSGCGMEVENDGGGVGWRLLATEKAEDFDLPYILRD